METEETMHRIFLMPSGYNNNKGQLRNKWIRKLGEWIGNPKLEQQLGKFVGYDRISIGIDKFRTWLNYHEELIDNLNKSAIILDEDTGKQLVEYAVDTVSRIPNSHILIAGDNRPELEKNSLENIIAKDEGRSVDGIFQMQRSYLENMQLLNEEAEKIRKKLISENKTVSPHNFVVFGDAYAGSLESHLDFIRKVEEEDADLSFGWSVFESKSLFDYRPWFEMWVRSDEDVPGNRPPNDARLWFKGKYNEFWGRNSNVAAFRVPKDDDDAVRGIPKDREYLIGMAYDVRKLLKSFPKLVWWAGDLVVQYMLSTKAPFKGLVKKISPDKLNKRMSRILNADVKLVYASSDLEPDIDSKNDVLRAKKMIWLEKNQWVTYGLALDLLAECENIGVKKIQLIGLNVEKEDICYVQDLARLIKDDSEYSPYFNPINPSADQTSMLFYDLKQAYDMQFRKNKMKVSANIKNTVNFILNYYWDNEEDQLKGELFSKEEVDIVINRGVFYQSLDYLLRSERIDSVQSAQVRKNIIKLNKIEGNLRKSELYNPARADMMVSKYCINKH